MKSISLRALPLWTGILGLGLTAALAQAPKPATPDAPKPAPAPAAADTAKPPVHKPEQSALNLVKQENRTNKQLKEVIEDLRKAEKNNQAAEKELKRINSQDLKEDPAKVLDSVKDKLSPEDTAALKAAMEKAKAALDNDEVRKLVDDAKKKAAASASSKTKSQPTTPPEKFGPSTFDQVPAPTPVKAEPVTAKVRTPDSTVTGDTIIFPPTSDPENPQKAISPKDPRSRTYIVTGSAQVKTPTLVLDADRIECIASEEGGGEGIGGLGKSPSKPKKTTNKIDPVQAGAGATGKDAKSDPFERIIATGRVNIVRIDKDKVVTGKGGSMIYEKKTGQMILTDWPEAQDGKNVIVAREKNAKIVIVPNGQSYGTNTKVLTMEEAKARTGGTPAPEAAAPPKTAPATPGTKPAAPRAEPVPPKAEPVR